MRVRIAPEVFATAVNTGTRNVPARPVAVIRSGVLLSATDGALTICSFDDEVTTRVRLPVTVVESGAAVVSGRLLAEMAKYLPPAPVELTHDGGQLRIDCGSAACALPLLPVEDYPALPEVPATVATVAAADFAAAIDKTVVAASKDDTVPMMTGVRLELNSEAMTLSATDRYRMAMSELAVDPTETGHSVLVPAKTLSALTKMLDGQRLTMAIAEGTVGFTCGGVNLVSRTMDGALPDLRGYLNFETLGEVRVDTAALLAAVRRVSFAAPRSGAVLLLVSDNRLTVSSGDQQSARARDTVECRYTGEGSRIAFNKSYLQDCLTAISSGTTVLSIASDHSRVLFTPDSGADYRHLIMPIRQRV